MERPENNADHKLDSQPNNKSEKKLGKILLFFVVIGVIALPIIIFQAFSVKTGEVMAKMNTDPVSDFDHNAKQLFKVYDRTTSAYMEGASTSRTLDYYYSLRQYPGSPPFLPHDLVDEKGVELVCLSCHERGGFARTMNKFTPVTPHPQYTYCGQCHLKEVTKTLFKVNEWVSVQTPILGRSALAGSPPPIAHQLQMRENCIACHVGPGTVVPIRVEHPMRGNCRQCHVPEQVKELFTRNPK
ncbi:MAG: cytochrome C [Deltaproteobacteria bacterium]|jgi:cytochrome c-type protein NapB|nr:cytochrome C [Deltaproteobacteria bacterium]